MNPISILLTDDKSAFLHEHDDVVGVQHNRWGREGFSDTL